MGRRPIAALTILVAASILGTSSCALHRTSKWIVEPIRYDNSIGEPPAMIDVTYSMHHLTGDTAGGFWTESAGSWLHVSEEGRTLHRFNILDTFPGGGVHSIAAVTPTQLVVSHDATGPNRAMSRFDADTMSWEAMVAEGDWIGDVAVAGESIYYVQYSSPPVVPAPFMIRRLDPGGALSTVLEIDATLLAENASIDVDRAGNVFVVTESQQLIVARTGTVTSRTEIRTEQPIAALSPAGNRLWSSDAPAAGIEWRLAGGSAEARAIVDRYSECDGTTLAVRMHGHDEVLPFLCRASAAVWLDDETLVVSAGTEQGTVLARVSAPDPTVSEQ